MEIVPMRPARVLSILARCFFAFTASAADERTRTMRDAAFPAPSMTYVLCEQDLLLAAEGATWSSICFRYGKNGFISGVAGQLLRTEDGGATWSQVKTPYTGWLTAVAFDSAGRG